MALYNKDEKTGETTPSPTGYAIDAEGAIGGDSSLLGDVWDFTTKGVPLTAMSIVNSFANTGIEIANLAGADIHKLDVNSWTDNPETVDYYNKHSLGIESAGLVAGALIPGGLALKGYNTAMKAAATRFAMYQAGEVTDIASNFLGLLPSVAKKNLINDTTVSIMGGTGFYDSLALDKAKALAMGAADNFLSSLTMEAAVAATMHASPILDDQSLGDIADNAFHGALIGGALGGAVDGFFMNGALNKAKLVADRATKPFEGWTDLGKGPYETSDRVVNILKDIDSIKEKMSGVKDFDLFGKLGLRKGESAVRQAETAAISSLTAFANGDGEVGSALFRAMQGHIDSIKQTGNASAVDEAFNYWSNLAGAGRVSADVAPTSTSDLVYVNSFAKDLENIGPHDMGKIFTPEAGAMLNPKTGQLEKLPGVDYSYAYQVNGTPRISVAGETLQHAGQSYQVRNAEEAFAAGYDVFVRPDGKTVINDKSSVLKKVARPGEDSVLPQYAERQFREDGTLPDKFKGQLLTTPQFIDTATGSVKEAITPVVGDFGKVRVIGDKLIAGEKEFSYSTTDNLIHTEMDPTEANGRFIWAAKRGVKAGDTIDSGDPAMMEAVYRDWAGASKSGKSFSEWIGDLDKRKINFRDERGFLSETAADQFADAGDVEMSMERAKMAVIRDYMETAGTKANMDVATRLSNISRKVADNLQDIHTANELMAPIEESENLRHIQVQFRLGNIKDQDGHILSGMQAAQYRIKIIRDRMDDAVRAAGPMTDGFVPALEDLKVRGTSTDALVDHAGADFTKQSRGAYGSFRQACEVVGNAVAKATARWEDMVASKFQPVAMALKDPKNKDDFQRLSNFVTALRSSDQKWMWLPEELRAEHMPTVPGQRRVAVLADSLIRDKQGNITGWDPSFAPEGFIKQSLTGEQTTERGLRNFYVLGEHGSNFMGVHHEANSKLVRAKIGERQALGMPTNIDPDIIYVPPVDLGAQKHFFIAVPKANATFGRPGHSIVVADSADSLMKKRLALENEFDCFTKGESEQWHKALADYQESRGFYQSRTDANLARKGVLNDLIPTTNPDNLIRQFADFHSRMGLGTIRSYAELANMQLFTELDHMDTRFGSMLTSTREGRKAASASTVGEGPFRQLKNTAMNVSSKENYVYWNQSNEAVERFADGAFRNVADALKLARMGKIDYEDVGRSMAEMGMGNPFGEALTAMRRYEIADRMPPARYLSSIIHLNNAMVGAMVIKYDQLQQLLHAISTPILMATEGYSVMSGGMARELVQTPVPGSEHIPVWAMAKPLYSSMKNFFNQEAIATEKLAMIARVNEGRSIGREEMSSFKDLAMPWGSGLPEGKYLDYMRKVRDFLSKPYNMTESFTNYIVADMAHDIFAAQGFEGRALEDNMWTFTNRVKANILTSQRPISFQGPIGQGVGLFQTYYLNMMQNLMRYVENGEAKTIGVLLGMQGSLFGAQGLPGVNLINQAIATADGNHGHADLYSTLPNYMGDSLAKWILYGSVSNVLNTNIYQRSDINPRQITLLPTNPLEWPGIAGSARLVKDIYDTTSRIANGGNIYNSFMLGLEHNGLSRPLTGLAEIMQGYSTTSKGGMVALNTDHPGGMSELFSGATFARLLGGRPLDESIIMNDMYRRNAFAAKDRERVAHLGEAVKSHMIDGKELSADQLADFASRYAAIGGNVKHFNQSILRWHQEATNAAANKVFEHMRTDPRAKQAALVMGGKPLPDYATASAVMQTSAKKNASTASAATGVSQTQQPGQAIQSVVAPQ